MAIGLKYTTIPSSDKVTASNFYQKVFDLTPTNKQNLKVNDELTFKFKHCDNFNILHFAFNVDEMTFSKIIHNITKEDISFSTNPFELVSSNQITKDSGKTIYFRDPNGHIIELSKE